MESSNEWKDAVPSVIADFQSLVSLCTSIASENQSYLANLQQYYKSLIVKDNHENEYWAAYERSFTKVQQLTVQLSLIMPRLTGEEFTKTLNDMRKKYYDK